MAQLEERRERFAAVERELAGLEARHDLAMSAFKFDEARDLQQRITVLEHERGELVEALPPPAELSPDAPRPVRVRRRRPTQRHRRLLRR